jgi:transketolase
VEEVDGNDPVAVAESLSHVPFEAGKPSCLIGHTTKGKGVSFMENAVLWHYRSPQDEELALALAELEGPLAELQQDNI